MCIRDSLRNGRSRCAGIAGQIGPEYSSRPAGSCTQDLEACRASRTPGHGWPGSGAYQRSEPSGGSAKGIPLKIALGPAKYPRIAPLSVWTIGSLASSAMANLLSTVANTKANVSTASHNGLFKAFSFDPAPRKDPKFSGWPPPRHWIHHA